VNPRFETLLADAIRIADGMLLKNGDLTPFALSDSKTGQGQLHVVRGNFQYPSEILPLVIAQLREAAGKNAICACAVVAAVHVQSPSGDKVTAVRVECEDADGNALTWFLPFEVAPGDVKFGKPFVGPHAATVFQRSGHSR
jgi:hypothetical protein